MPYNDKISSGDLAGLIPPEYTNEILQHATEQSAVLRLARRLRDMPTSTRTMPVVSALPMAYFVNGETGPKQTTKVTWANKIITAEELAVIVPIPQHALDDSDYPVWDEAKPYIEEAAGYAIDQAVLYGINMPASWQISFGGHAGVVAMATAAGATVSLAAKTDMYEALMDEGGLLAQVETDGFVVTGHIAHTTLKGKLRGCRDANGQPIFTGGGDIGKTFQTGTIDGAQVLYPLNGAIDDSLGLDIAGQWSELVYAMRKDISWTVADQAIIQDGAGAIIYNAFQQDMVALRMVFRLGFALPNPINRIQPVEGSRSPFAVLTA
jgi:HK97 family phage major capsid protein